MEEFREIELNGVKLRVYRDGTIMRYVRIPNQNYKLGWNICQLNPDSSEGYLRIGLNKKYYKVHRIIGMVYIGLDINDPNKQIDHIDRCRDNNNVTNLQIVSNQQNTWNRSNTIGYNWCKHNNKWRARIAINNKRIHLGYFNNEEDAHNAYLEAKAKYHVINHPHNLHPK